MNVLDALDWALHHQVAIAFSDHEVDTVWLTATAGADPHAHVQQLVDLRPATRAFPVVAHAVTQTIAALAGRPSRSDVTGPTGDVQKALRWLCDRHGQMAFTRDEERYESTLTVRADGTARRSLTDLEVEAAGRAAATLLIISAVAELRHRRLDHRALGTLNPSEEGS